MGAAAVKPSAPRAVGPFFVSAEGGNDLPVPPPLFPLRYFGWLPAEASLESAPDWFLHPLTREQHPGGDRPWYELGDFDPSFGDIKWIWELSRLDWVVRFAQNARFDDQGQVVDALNSWLDNWSSANPEYVGPNWKCGQETSIRLLNMALAARILGQEAAPSARVKEFVMNHLRRIAASTHYAVAQDNNHGTSEGAALFVGGSWMAPHVEEAAGYAAKGRRMLEDRVGKLVMDDGTFSQYSVNYHRMMLDTLSFVELWRAAASEALFSAKFYGRAQAAASWLRDMVDDQSGDAPNIGANDGARLLPLTDGYRDYRPSVQLSYALFWSLRAYGSGKWNEHLAWLGVAVPERLAPEAGSREYRDGGFAILRTRHSRAVIRFPRFKFRPSHADALHLDFWCRGENVLCDSGTFSYAASTERIANFAGVTGHNTVQFDGHDQMPKLSRFLYGRWLAVKELFPLRTSNNGAQVWGAAYSDWCGARHERQVSLTDRECLVTDRVDHFKQSAVLRWHLRFDGWVLQNNVASRDGVAIYIAADVSIKEVRLAEADISLHYGKTERIRVLEVELAQPGTIWTTIRYS